jgi:predicted PolB exonuclease-like 3'-5' exonuclease
MAANFQKIEPAGHIVFDLEIARSVEEVGGWDFTGEMGVSCAVVYEMDRQRYRMYDSSELEELQECLDRADRITTWNGWNFDLPVVYGINRPDWASSLVTGRIGGKDNRPLAERSNDLLRRAWQAQGLDPDKGGSPAHAGWRLHDVSEALGFGGKCDDGKMAPEMYKQGQWGKLMTYCLHDVKLTTLIEQFASRHGFLRNMRNKVVNFNRK